MKKQSPMQKAKRRYNKLVDYCTDTYYGSCNKCPYPAQCDKLAELRLCPRLGVMFDQCCPDDRKKITQILGVSAKELSKCAQ